MGLLDLFDNPDAQVGLGLLAAAAPRADAAGFGQRLFEGINNAQGMRDAAAKRQLQQIQLQAAMQDQKFMQGIYGAINGDPSGQPQPSTPIGQGSSQVPPQGAMPQGGQTGLPQQQGPQGTYLGLNRNALVGAALGGKAELGKAIVGQNTPDWKVVDGNLIDVHKQGFAGGLQDGVFTSADGQTLVRRIAPDGTVTVGPAAGSIDAYKGYKKAAADVANENEVMDVPVKGPDGITRMVKMTKADFLSTRTNATTPTDPVAPPDAPPLQNNSNGPLSSKLQAFIQADAAKNGIQNPVAKFSGGVGYGFKPSAQSGAQSVGVSEAPQESKITEEKAAAAINAAKAEATAAPLLNVIKQAREINYKVPYGPFGLAEGKAMFSGLPGANHNNATNAALWDQMLGQSILGTISNVAAAGGIRMDIPIVKEIQKAGGIPMSLPPESRARMLDQLESEVLSKVNATKNLVPALNKEGISSSSDVSPMVDNAPKPSSDQSEQKKNPPIAIKGMVRNGFKFMGGDPSKKESWMKVGDNNG